MFNRQRVLLEFIKRAGAQTRKLHLTKWSFLLKHEMPSNGGSAFYDFVPYRFGPFSFSLYQELEKLSAANYLRPCGDGSICLNPKMPLQGNLPRTVSSDISSIIRRFGSAGPDDLIDYVYERHPQFTFNSEIRQLAPKPSARTKIYTAGYEGRSIDSFLNLLAQTGIKQLLDVRRNPIARRYGFHKSTLDRLCGYLGIRYVHLPELGICSSKRQSLNSAEDYERLFDDYESTTLASENEAIARLIGLIKETPSVLVCMEADHCSCHRSRLASEVARRSGLTVRHLV